MGDVRKILRDLAAAEEELRVAEFLAPRVRGGGVRAQVAGLVYTFAAEPRDFEGWGIFRPVSASVARLVEEASLPRVAAYLAYRVPSPTQDDVCDYPLARSLRTLPSLWPQRHHRAWTPDRTSS